MNPAPNTRPGRFREGDEATAPGQLGGLPDAPIANAAAALSLGRAVREAVANVAKHSRANRCSISIRFRPGAVAVGVRDDGVGFPTAMPASAGGGRHGLVGMERRVRSCGGRLRTRRPSGPSSGGARIRIVVPLPLQRVSTDVNATSSLPPVGRAGR